ncbi:hypothetical protein PMIN06_002520 [Paraphaeosphaeria minitans]
MLFFSFFKTLVDSEITVELKNEVCIRGTLKSVDQYLNIKLDNAEATDELSAQLKTCSFEAPSSDTYTCPAAPSTQHYWRMRPGERPNQRKTRRSEMAMVLG